MNFGLADLLDDKLDCECQGGTWKQHSASYASCDPGPLTTGLYWDKDQHRCKSPFDTSTPPRGELIGGCPPGMSCPPGRRLTYYRGSCYCKPDVPGWAGPALAVLGFAALFWIVSR